jgi:hypothetical protein
LSPGEHRLRLSRPVRRVSALTQPAARSRVGREAMAQPESTLYGDCPCGGTIEPRLVPVKLVSEWRDPPVFIESVPLGACGKCGARVYKAEILGLIESAWRNAPADPLFTARFV